MIRLPAFLIAVLSAALLQPVSAQERLPPLVTKGLSTCDFLQEVGAALHGYDIYHVASITPHLTRIYIVLRYERHPMFLMVSAYSPVDDDWRVTAINWDRDPDKVFPEAILDPQMPGR